MSLRIEIEIFKFGSIKITYNISYSFRAKIAKESSKKHPPQEIEMTTITAVNRLLFSSPPVSPLTAPISPSPEYNEFQRRADLQRTRAQQEQSPLNYVFEPR